MKMKDNVYGETTQTEKIAQAKESAAKDTAQKEMDVSAVLGKFKDVNALAKAYGALEAEFTKRSQRLKELERITDNWQVSADAALGAEKLRKHAKERREESKVFNEFLFSVGKAHTDGADDGQPVVTVDDAAVAAEGLTRELGLEKDEKEGGRYALNEKSVQAAIPDGEVNAAEQGKGVADAAGSVTQLQDGVAAVDTDAKTASEKVLSSVANHGIAETSSEELYQRASRDEQVRLKIIGEYLSSIGKAGAPLTAGGAGVPIAPPVRAKTIGDAGAMALRYFKQPSNA